MRLLITNPNINTSTNDRITAVARPLMSSEDSLEVVSAQSGVELIETVEQSHATIPAVLSVIRERHREIDAVVIAAFSDPGLEQARSIAECPVLGIAESAMTVAAQCAEQFTIVTLGAALRGILRHNAVAYGYAEQLASIRVLPWGLPQVAADPLAYRDAFAAECARAVDEDGAGAIIIGGGPLSGLADAVGADLAVPVLDGVRCAVELARGRGVSR